MQLFPHEKSITVKDTGPRSRNTFIHHVQSVRSRPRIANDSNGGTSSVRTAALNCMRKEVKNVIKLGLHARPASEFVRCVIRFKS